MGTSDKLTLQMLDTEPHFAMIPRTLSPILPSSKSGMERSLEFGSHSSDSGMGQDYTGRHTTVPEQVHYETGVKLAVKHVTSSGTQRGNFLERYLVHSHSKAIICRDCGIFFSLDAFLAHSHDKHGRKRHRPQTNFLELDVGSPSSQQLRVWEKFLSTTGQKAKSGSSVTQSMDLGNGEGERILEQSSGNHLSTERPANYPPDEHLINDGNPLSDFDKSVRNTVNASERLLRETSQYLHTSAEKLRHRRQKSLRNYQLRPTALLPNNEETINSAPPTERVQPVIKDALSSSQNSKRPNRKFLEKYLEKSRDSFQLLTESMASKSASKPETSFGLEGRVNTEYPQQESLRMESDDIKRDVQRLTTRVVKRCERGGGDADGQAVNRVSPRPSSPEKTPRGKSILLQEHFDRNDPLFIVQTAQELLALAAHKMQERPPKSPGGIDWQKRYEMEKDVNQEKDKRIKELEGLLKEEQRKRKNIEVQLRATRLQNL